MKDQLPEEQKAQVWSEAAEVVKTHYEELTSRWKEESDTLLVYVSIRFAAAPPISLIVTVMS